MTTEKVDSATARILAVVQKAPLAQQRAFVVILEFIQRDRRNLHRCEDAIKNGATQFSDMLDYMVDEEIKTG